MRRCAGPCARGTCASRASCSGVGGAGLVGCITTPAALRRRVQAGSVRVACAHSGGARSPLLCRRRRQFFTNGKTLPVERGSSVHQPVMSVAARLLGGGGWLHVFPEGKVQPAGDVTAFRQVRRWAAGRGPCTAGLRLQARFATDRRLRVDPARPAGLMPRPSGHRQAGVRRARRVGARSGRAALLPQVGPLLTHMPCLRLVWSSPTTPVLKSLLPPVCRYGLRFSNPFHLVLCCFTPHRSGMARVMPYLTTLPRAGHDVTVVVGEPVDLSHVTCRCAPHAV